MMDPVSRSILVAQGYSELGMTVEALNELDTIGANDRERPEVLETRLFVVMRARRWQEALAVSRRICEIAPDAPAGYVHSAFCLHELGETEMARAVLLSGPPSLMNEPTYHYNLACYECRLGNVEAARAHLDMSVEMDRKFRAYAKCDPDLKLLRDGA